MPPSEGGGEAANNRTRRYIWGGLLTASAVAITLALVFTIGGVSPKDKRTSNGGEAVSTLGEGGDDVSIGQVKSVLDQMGGSSSSKGAASSTTGSTTTGGGKKAVNLNRGDPLQVWYVRVDRRL